MPQIEEFLSHVMPDTGIFCLANPTEYGWSHKVVGTIEQLSKLAVQSDNQRKETFFAVATLKEPRVWDEKKPDKKTGLKGAWAIRTHANMSHYKSLILDIDCNNSKKNEYANQQEGFNALKSFCQASGMPKPTIVNSGRGWHVYWTLADVIDADTWFELSTKAATVYKHFGLKFDPSRTKDRSSVLRVAGTHHYKDRKNVKDVSVAFWGTPTPIEELEAILDKSIAFYNLSVPVKHEPKSALPAELAALYAGVTSNIIPDEPVNIDWIFAKCNQMAYVKEVGGPAGYNIRASAVSIMKLAKDPDYSILLKDDPNPETVDSQTDMFLADSITDNPHTCERFELENEGGCRGCQHKGKIKSPAVLGREHTTKPKEPAPIVAPDRNIESPDVAPDGEFDFSKLSPPPGYSVSKGGVFLSVPSENGSTNEMLYDYGFYPYERVWDYGQGIEVTKCRVHLPHQEIREFEISGQHIADLRTFAKTIANYGIIAAGQEQTGMLLNYMSNYIRELQKTVKSTASYAQLGWHEDGEKFVMPGVMYDTEGNEHPCSTSSKIAQSTEAFRKHGSFEKWRSVIDTYAQDGFEGYAFAHLSGYGSLLFDMTEYNGAILNLIGESGSGKSTILRTINSIYGHPDEGMLMQQDKYLARIKRVGVYSNLPVTYDEITTIKKDELQELCYSISQGRERMRLTNGADERENNSRWKLIMICSSNASLYDILGANKANASAEAMRVFEYRVDCNDAMTPKEAALTFSKLTDNFGHAGEKYIKYVIQNRDKIKEEIIEMRSKFDEVANVPGPERYWSNIVACNMVGGLIAKRLELHSFDMNKLFKWAVEQITSMRSSVKEIKREAKSLLVEFMNENIGGTITVKGTGIKGDKQYVPSDGEPRGNLLVRSEVDLGHAFIAREAIRTWLINAGADYTAVRRDLIKSKILVNDDMNKVLTTGSSTLKSGSSKCWLVDTNHKDMSGAVLSIVSNTVEEKFREKGLM